MFLIVSILVLVGCFGTDEQAPKQNSGEVDTSEIERVEINEEQARERIEYAGLGEVDDLTNLEIEGDEIRVTIKLGKTQIPLPVDENAVSTYSAIGEELLQHEGWEVLTIEFLTSVQ